MPSLLQKLSYFDPETGRYFIVADDGFYWKEAKKAPEESKVTKLMQDYGWELRRGNEMWLIFKRPQQRGEVTVTRGTKEWYYDTPGMDMLENIAEGRGMESLQQALESGTFGGRAKAMTAAYIGPERRKDMERRQEWDRTAMYQVSLSHLEDCLLNSSDPAECKHIEDEIARLREMQATKTSGSASTAVNSAGSRKPMHDDSGALTGLRARSDYGESDSYTVEMNEANAKIGAVLVLGGGIKTKRGATKVPLYVTAVEFEPGNAFKLSTFRFSPDASKAKVFRQRTAENLQKQIHRFGAVTRIKQAGESSLNGFSITVPQKRFWDLIVTKGAHTVKNEQGQVQFKSKAAWDEFKDRLVEDYKIKKDSILFYNEYMKKKRDGELGDKPKWNVVVPPGGGDDAANDRAVIGAYLMWH